MYKVFSALLLATVSCNVWSGSVEDAVSSIERKIERELRHRYASAYVEHKTTFRVPRSLASVECDEFEVSAPTRGVLGRASWPISCKGDAAVSSRLVTRTHLIINVPTLTRKVARGDVIHVDDWKVRPERVSREMGYVLRVDTSYLAARSLRAGGPVKLDHLTSQKVVNAGDVVNLLVQQLGVSVQVEVIAMSSADVGQGIQVKSQSSGKLMDAVVASEGIVILAP